MSENQTIEQPAAGTTVVVNQIQPKKGNGLGVAGFVLALIALILSWIPFVGIVSWIFWIPGLILSFIGVFKKPRGLAIAGLVISFISVIVLTVVVGAMFGAASSLF